MESPDRNRYFAYKMGQAREAYEQAEGLWEDDAEPGYVMNSLYYAFYYPVLALLRLTGADEAMQSVSIALFEKRFSGSDMIDSRFFLSIRKAFELKPKCTDAAPKVPARADLEALFLDARDFHAAVERAAQQIVGQGQC